jgi:hypothetical protein
MGAISSEPAVGQVAIFGQVSTRTVKDYEFPLRRLILDTGPQVAIRRKYQFEWRLLCRARLLAYLYSIEMITLLFEVHLNRTFRILEF